MLNNKNITKHCSAFYVETSLSLHYNIKNLMLKGYFN